MLVFRKRRRLNMDYLLRVLTEILGLPGNAERAASRSQGALWPDGNDADAATRDSSARLAGLRIRRRLVPSKHRCLPLETACTLRCVRTMSLINIKSRWERVG